MPLGTHKATKRIKNTHEKIRRKMPGAADLRKLQNNKYFTDEGVRRNRPTWQSLQRETEFLYVALRRKK